MRTLLVTLAFALTLGCSAHYPDGRYVCITLDSECPPGLHCFAGLCSRDAPDGATSPDAGSDAGTTILPDANCGTIGCATIRVTHAWSGGPMQLPIFTLNGISFAALNYGETSPDVQVPLTDATMITLTIPGMGTANVHLDGGPAHYTVVISAGTGMMPTTTILENNFSGATGMTRLRYASVINGGGTFTLRRGATAIGTFGGFDLPLSDALGAGDDEAIVLGMGTNTLAAFGSGATDIPRDSGSGYFVIFAGRTDRSLLDATGIRMILATPGLHIRSSGPIAWFLNGNAFSIDLCTGAGIAGLVQTIDPATLVGPLPAFDASGATRPFGVVKHGTMPCAFSGTPTMLPPMTPGPLRLLVAAMPDAGMAGGIILMAAAEAPDPLTQAGTVAESIEFMNATPAKASLGTWDGTAFTATTGANMVAGGSAGTVFVTARPASVAVQLVPSATTLEFDWQEPTPLAPVSFAVPSVDSTPDYALWEVFAPYGGAWSAMSHIQTAIH